jgi:molybdopterin converting factor small subunit
MQQPQVTVEFFGMVRAQAGRAELIVCAVTVDEALTAVTRTCPALAELRQADGRLSPRYLLSLDGGPFSTDLRQPLRPGVRLLLLSADAGG